MINWKDIEQQITQCVDEPFQIEGKRSVGGGSINDAWQVSGNDQNYFIKINNGSLLDMFDAERDGLQAMFETNTIRVPQAVLTGISDGHAFIVLEHINLGGSAQPALMGQQLAGMHQSGSDRFGWFRDNTIGATPQVNDWTDNWVDFWAEHRLGYQTRLASRNGIGSKAVRLCEQLQENIGDFFTDYQPQPSLLHGDLWGGNAAFDEQGQPVIFDPACYYGDREADVAMTELFGGFGGDFYQGYNQAWPLDPGYSVRKILYNQYHILNHFNLFGGGYGMQAERMAASLLAECG